MRLFSPAILLVLEYSNAFAVNHVFINPHNALSKKYVKPLQNSLAPPPLDDTPIEEDDEVGASDYEETNALIIDFVRKISETPVGEMDQDDLDFLKPILKELDYISESGREIGGDAVHLAEITETLVQRLVVEWQEAVINDIPIGFQPEISIFNSAILAWNRADSRNIHEMVSEKVFRIYEEAIELFESGLDLCRPTVKTTLAMLEMIAGGKSKDSGDEAMALFDRMVDLGISPSAKIYEIVIEMLSKSRHKKESASQADELLRKAVASFPATFFGADESIDIKTFNSVLAAWSKSDERTSSSRIESILALMHGYGLKPNLQSFTIYIDSFAQKLNWDSVQESDRILTRMIDMYLAKQLDFEPDVITYTSVIRGWMRLSKKNSEAAEMAENVMERMIVLQDEGHISARADSVVYCSVLNAYCYAGLVEDADRILSTMEYLSKQGEDMKPSARTYKTLMEGWVKSDLGSAMTRAEELLEKMKNICKDDNEEDLLGDAYKSLLFGYAKRSNPFKAEENLRLMVEHGYKVDSFCFDKVVESYTRKETDDQVQIKRVYGIFELMESCQKSGQFKANERLYTSLIRAIAKDGKSGAAKNAQTIVKRMIHLYDNGNKSVQPNIFTYNALLKACAKSASFDDAEKASAFSIAIATFNKIRSSDENVRPDQVTYSNLMKCSQLLPEGENRDNLIKATFAHCEKNKLINQQFLEDVDKFASERLSRMLLQNTSA